MIKISNIFRVAIIVCTLVMLRYLLLLPVDQTGMTNEQRSYVALTGLILAVITFVFCMKTEEQKNRSRWLWQYVRPYCVVIVASAVITWINYRYTAVQMIIAITPFLYIFFAFPLLYIFCCDHSVVRFIRVVVWMQIIILMFKAIGWYTYNYSSTPYFESLVREFDAWIRNGVQRVEPGQLFGLALAFFIFILSKQRNKLMPLAVIVFMIWFLVIVTQFRFQMATALAVLCTCILFIVRKRENQVIVSAVFIVGIIFIMATGFISQFLESFSTSGQLGSSTMARILNIRHFYEEMIQKKAVLGLGLIVVSNEQAADLLVRDKWTMFYLDDIGILGGVVRFGVMSVVVYGLLFVKIIKTCILCIKRKYEYRILVIGISAYLILSCLALNIYDAQRAFAVPFYLAILSYLDADLRGEAG